MVRHLVFLPVLALEFGLERPHAAVEVGRALLGVAHGEEDLPVLVGAGELDPRRQQDRLAEADVDLEGVGQPALQRRQARALVHIPCAIAPGKPSGFAVSECMWIGLRSPETPA